MKVLPKKLLISGLSLSCLLMVACSSNQDLADTIVGNLCPDARPAVCTADYRPVCAVMTDASRQTFSNGCSACSNPETISWVDAACAE